MTSLEIILIFSFILVSMVFLRFIRIKNDECDDLHMQKCIQLQKLYFIAQSGKLDSILSVKDFNEWFNSDKDPEIYAHKGIFLRLDKLSQQHIDSYVQYETEGLLGYGDFNWVTMKKFENEIIEDWQNKLRQNDEEREESN